MEKVKESLYMNLNHVEQLKILSVLGMAFVYFEVNIFQKIT